MNKIAIRLGVSLFVFTILLAAGHAFLKPDSFNKIEELNDGWTVYFNDDVYHNISLSQLRKNVGRGANKGDIILFVKDNVDFHNYVSPALMFESRFSAWTVYVDTEKADSDYFDEYRKNKFIGCQRNFVVLPKKNGPSTIRIALAVAENGAYNYYEAPAVGGYLDLMMYGVYNNMIVFLLSVFLIVFGVIFFAVGVGFRSNVSEINMQIYSSLLFFVIGIWFLTQFQLLDLFIETHGHQTELEYISLYLIVPIMYMVMGSMKNYFKNKIFLMFMIPGSILPVILILIHFLGIVHINRMLFIYQLDCYVLLGYMIVAIIIKDIRLKGVSKSQFIQIVGQMALGVTFIFNVVFYYLEVAGISEQILLSKLAIPLGAMCMVFATLLNYYVFISESIAREREYALLAHTAFVDELTGMANRAKYDKFMSQLSETEDDYCLISIDLNGLKDINDKKGHLEGDKYLCEFGKVLEETIGQEGFIARTGGDEFVAILTDDKMEKVDVLIDKLKSGLAYLNEKDSSIKRSAAVGYACRHEYANADYNLIYLKADERMYKKKELMHGTRS